MFSEHHNTVLEPRKALLGKETADLCDSSTKPRMASKGSKEMHRVQVESDSILARCGGTHL